jgi:hypothetical protein
MLWRDKLERGQFGGIVSPEVLVLVATVGLLLQIVPSHGMWNVWNWSRGSWLGVNCGILLALVGIRLGRPCRDIVRARRGKPRTPGIRQMKNRLREASSDYEMRTRRDAEWRERARARMPFT